MRRTRAVTVAALVLALAGPAWSAAAQGPVEPPPVQPGLRPSTAEASTFPYQEVRQVGPAVRAESCVRPAPEGLNLAAVPPAQERLRIEEAQQFATGLGQTVAVIDSGVNPHPRLAGRLDDGGDYILGDTGLSDCEGHGTVVAGILAAAPDPDTGFVGVAPDARVLSIRQSSSFFSVEITDADGEGTTDKPAGDTTSMARAIVRAVNTPGVSVINISEAACFGASAADNPPDGDLQAAIAFAVERDVVVVTAAANSGGNGPCQQNPDRSVSTIVSPAWFDENVLTVGATAVGSGAPADFSIRGPWVDVAAPGDEVVSLDPAGGGLTATLSDSEGERFAIAGTSFATPYVAGLAALVRERFPELSALEVIDRIQRTAQHTAGPGGRDTALGYGVIDPVAALTDVPVGSGAPAAAPEQAAPARLQNFALPPQEDPARRVVALAGAGAGIAALGVTLLTVFTVKRYRRSKLAGR